MSENAVIRLRKVKPIGSHKSLAFVDRFGPADEMSGGLEEVEVLEYPPEIVGQGEALRQARLKLGLSLRVAAAAIALPVVRLCDLERGAMTAPQEDLDAAVEAWSRSRSSGAGDHR